MLPQNDDYLKVQHENFALKKRVVELEDAIDGYKVCVFDYKNVIIPKLRGEIQTRDARIAEILRESDELRFKVAEYLQLK